MERSQGKLRPSRPRLKDLRTEPHPPLDRTVGRDASGRFAPGYKGSTRGKGWKRAITRLAGPHVKGPELHAIAGDAGSLFRAWLAELPHDGPTVSAIVAEGSRSAVLSAHLAARALEVGLETAKGRALLELSVKLGQRAERTAVTAYDLSQRLAEAEHGTPARPGTAPSARKGELSRRLHEALHPPPASAQPVKQGAPETAADALARELGAMGDEGSEVQ